MARNSKKKLAIFAGTSKCLIYAEAKYCASEMPGEIKYYECSRTEYCCAFGCCVSPGLHFHHLWYYWVLVIIMFLVCSGGGWWYRYWLQGRYRAAASAIPTRSSNSRSQNSFRNAPCQAQQARITYNSARNTVLLHRMWKGPQRNAAPAYNGSNATTSTHYQNMNVVLNDANCPYYQLYGPPPSYETVIAQTRGKISNPTSPESARLNLQTANVIPNPSVPQCFFYTCNSSPRMVNGNSNQCPSDNNRQLDGHETVPFAHFSQYCSASGAINQNMCIPLEYSNPSITSGGNFIHGYQSSSDQPPAYATDRSFEASDTAHGCAVSRNYREPIPWNVTSDQPVLEIHDDAVACENRSASQSKCVTAVETHTPLSKSPEASGSEENEPQRMPVAIPAPVRERNFPRERKNYGGSLRLPRRHVDATYQSDNFRRVSLKERSVRDTSDSTGTPVSECAARKAERADVYATSSSQSNPSNNVILETFIFENVPPPNENVEEARGIHAIDRSTNFDLESKHKLDRSKSLD